MAKKPKEQQDMKRHIQSIKQVTVAILLSGSAIEVLVGISTSLKPIRMGICRKEWQNHFIPSSTDSGSSLLLLSREKLRIIFSSAPGDF